MVKETSEVNPQTDRATADEHQSNRAQTSVTDDRGPGDPQVDSAPVASSPPQQELTEQEIEERARKIGVRPDLFDEDEYSPDEYEQMLSMYEDTLRNIEEGEIVKARVLRVTDSQAILDLGFKSEGAVPLEEFQDPTAVEAGDEVDVFLESLEDQEGVVVLSKKKADFLKVWEKIKDSYDNDRPIGGTIKKKVKGGLTVDIMGVDAFLPGSQVALRRVPNIEDLIGDEYEFKILKLNKRRRNIVVSRRVILEEDRAEKRETLKKELEVGQVRKGVVKNITDFGAFIDLGGMDGLLHITDMSWGRVGHPGEVCKIGDEIEVKVLHIDWERERISLGLKQLQPYPWKDVEKKYPVGSRVRGRVVSITNYGAFVELEKGVEGLVHISEMSWTQNVRHPSQLVSIGDEIEVVVLRVDPEEEKISLGMKQIEEDPWLSLPEKYPPGTRIRGKVRNLTSFGAFVEVEPGIDGLVHISDMSWTKRVQHPSEMLQKGDEVEVIVLSIDVDQKRISLGLKQTEEDPWYQLAQTYSPGTETEGSVVRLLDKGVVVDLGNDVEGFIPISQLAPDQEIREASDVVVEGDQLKLKVMESDPINRRIVLQVLELPERPPEAAADAETAAAETEAEAAEAEPETVAVEAEAETAVADEAGTAAAEAEAETAAAEADAETAAAEAEAETAAEAEAGTDAAEDAAEDTSGETTAAAGADEVESAEAEDDTAAADAEVEAEVEAPAASQAAGEDAAEEPAEDESRTG